MSDERLQRGIYLRRKERPAACYRLLVLNVTPGATGRELRDALADIAALLAGLKAGRVPELAGLDTLRATHVAEQYAGLRWLLGFGRRIFDDDHHDPPLTCAARPAYLAYLPLPQAAFPTLPWNEA